MPKTDFRDFLNKFGYDIYVHWHTVMMMLENEEVDTVRVLGFTHTSSSHWSKKKLELTVEVTFKESIAVETLQRFMDDCVKASLDKLNTKPTTSLGSEW